MRGSLKVKNERGHGHRSERGKMVTDLLPGATIKGDYFKPLPAIIVFLKISALCSPLKNKHKMNVIIITESY